MATENTAFCKTQERWLELISRLEDHLASENFDEFEQAITTLRTYTGCPYCSKFRKVLSGRIIGCCRDCPVHILGEKKARARLAYNGCYQVREYREMVRACYWFRDVPSRSSAQAVIDSLKAVFKALEYYASHIDDKSD